jgi:hypothetical protein
LNALEQIQALVRNGLYYLTEHADVEAGEDGFDIYRCRTWHFDRKSSKALAAGREIRDRWGGFGRPTHRDCVPHHDPREAARHNRL